jgi:alkanesulfonate monooxygenase SsuD/methylene tetrahydromethanopterin reductase-like flavin-dependent oxidoreductase (luciferase family)
MAELGVGILIIPQKPWKEVAKELTEYHALYRQINGVEPPPPVSAGWTFCDPDPERAREQARRWIGGYFRSVLDHYRFGDEHMKTTKGYEYYAKMNDKIHTYGDEKVIDFFVDLQVWGTPEQCYDKILDVRRRVGNDHFVGVFSYAGMPAAEAERSLRLFAAEVIPALQRLEHAPAAAVSSA